MMEINYISWESDWSWCVICPGLPVLEQDERTVWCEEQGMNFYNSGVRYWFNAEVDVIMFRLRWS